MTKKEMLDRMYELGQMMMYNTHLPEIWRAAEAEYLALKEQYDNYVDEPKRPGRPSLGGSSKSVKLTLEDDVWAWLSTLDDKQGTAVRMAIMEAYEVSGEGDQDNDDND